MSDVPVAAVIGRRQLRQQEPARLAGSDCTR